MSKTIETNSGSKFLTSINFEHIIGTLCREVGAKFQDNEYCQNEHYADMAYEMTEEEVNDTIEKLKSFYDTEKGKSFLERRPYFFAKNYTYENFIDTLDEIIELLGDSKGYHCLY